MLRRNYLEISCAAAASVRFGVSFTATAVVINGLLVDLVKAGHVGEDKKHPICDCKKVFRAKERAMKCSKAEENYNIERSCATGIFVDSRKDNTLKLLYDTISRTCRKRVFKENQITVTEEPKDRYLTHYTPKSNTKTTKSAK